MSLLLLFIYHTSSAQFYDRTWMVGASPISTLTFNGIAIDTGTFYGGFAHYDSSVLDLGDLSNISDTNGNILFYTNGLVVATRTGNPNVEFNIMEGGDTLTDSLFYAYWLGPGNGYNEPQNSLILPRSGNTFYLFYVSASDSDMNAGFPECDRLYYAVVDMNQNGGLGKVISKKNVLHTGFFGNGRITACRHANGRDWWLVHQGEDNDAYYIYLVTADSIYPPAVQHIGPSSFAEDNYGAQSVFSPDGSKFATCTIGFFTSLGLDTAAIGSFVLMDFDRCSGIFSHPDSIALTFDSSFYYNGQNQGPAYGAVGCCFSPSGRFLYMTNGIQIWQYDSWAANVSASRVMVGQWDTIGLPGYFLNFWNMALMPNGKIIIDDIGGGGNAFHLIDSPDVQGMGCHFIFNGLPTSTNNANAIPNMINYQLGALAGSPCDTITPLTVTLFDSICQGHYVSVGSHTYTASGTYNDTLTAQLGGDSIVVLNLMVNQTLLTSINDSIAYEGSVTIGMHTYTQSGIYVDTLASMSGCDSIVTLTLTVRPNGIAQVTDTKEMFTFMPVPASEYLILAYKASEDFTVRIYTVTGIKMADLNMKAGNLSQNIDIDKYTTGMYFYEILRDSDKSVLKRGDLSIFKH